MRIIIAGSRHFTDYELLMTYCDKILQNTKDIEIVSGGAKGADELGERYARERGYKLTILRADWETYGKAAGPVRNKIMAMYADALIAFWDGNSRGTKNMIEIAKGSGLLVRLKLTETS